MKLTIKSPKIFAAALIALGMSAAGCKKFIDVDAPSDQLVTSTAFATDNTLKSTISGMYITMAYSNSYDLQFNLSFLTGNSSDEFKFYVPSSDYDPYYFYTLATDEYKVAALWADLYSSIYQANSIIEGVQNSTGTISSTMKTEAISEAKFVRAFCHFNLVNLYGDVPIVTTTDAVKNNTLYRSKKEDVYKQIISDLTDARDHLLTDYSYANGERTRPNKYVAQALLSRAYLYAGDWANAQLNADSVINHTELYNLLSTEKLGGIFVKNNQEAIWQVTASPAAFVGFTQEGQYYSFGSKSIPNYLLSDYLVKAFETGDKRFDNWVGTSTYEGTTYYYPFKYKQSAEDEGDDGEYCTYLRLAEQYLISAEAKAQQNNLSGAIAAINVIRSRAGLPATTASSQADILLAVEQERRIELFGEYGHRWNDLRRTGRADAVLSKVKEGWTTNAALYPIPKYDRNNNHNLTQNPGYGE
ncbi:Starch-binding associating with outer membrane [Chitinophaga costaii]|uniref:Starch-binding associating with outer membrane n=1 Tax=Chitinophaga costaii TaxID=1335309 RepID=A0A1C4G7K3_9BACT|nr:RagB/SusD family nutrient uptake outer membrane protein [Chitinophaga costaii]PUZ19439.1 RagB/SusD family nutrient uptake outer membrane protein [Chitinophaga costaii]SCC64179.1 Starch-binding associating with outer membrane [Chitinophaga costaii]